MHEPPMEKRKISRKMIAGVNLFESKPGRAVLEKRDFYHKRGCVAIRAKRRSMSILLGCLISSGNRTAQWPTARFPLPSSSVLS
jgi:hypothetical protein